MTMIVRGNLLRMHGLRSRARRYRVICNNVLAAAHANARPRFDPVSAAAEIANCLSLSPALTSQIGSETWRMSGRCTRPIRKALL